MSPRRFVRTILALAFLVAAPSRDARADWLFTPFVGSSFGTETSYLLLEPGAASSTQLIFGGSVARLSRGILGVEGDFSYAPRFFERDNRAGIIVGSNIYTLSGSVIAAVPLSITRESLRPYVVGGFGLIHTAAQDTINFLTIDDNLAGMNVGGGAVGLISPRAGFRFEIRQFRTLSNGENPLTGIRGTRLSFWRATVGVTVRIPN